jgi:TonB-dependent receptor
MFNTLDETLVDASLDWSLFFTNWRDLPSMVKFGPQYSTRQRDFASRRFRFQPINTRGVDLTLPPERLFTSQYIGPNFELREETRTTDFYEGEMTQGSFYGMVDLPLAARWRLVGGVRVENFTQRVDTFDLFDVDVDGDAERIRGEIDNTDVFPGVNLVWAVAPEQNLRFGVSQTVNRPEFRELAPFEFTDIVGGRAVAGNPDLKHALIQNYDVRWEWFPRAEEVVAASFFYKNLDRPIERVVEPTAQLRTSYRNAESARNAGLELEARKRFGAHFLAGLNYTFVDSQVQLGAEDTVVLTSLQRPLAGTSRHLFNGIVETRVGRTTARLLVNYYDDRIADVGSLGLPDIIEQGRPTVDLVLSHRLGPFNVRFAAENLTNREIRYEQGGEPQRAFTIGRTFLLQVAYVTF